MILLNARTGYDPGTASADAPSLAAIVCAVTRPDSAVEEVGDSGGIIVAIA